MLAVANYTDKGHKTLEKLHLFPAESCNVDDMKHSVKLDTREKMMAAILSVSHLEQLCEHEWSSE